MKKYVDGKIMVMTAEEIAAMIAETEAAERAYWLGDYDHLVNEEIRKRYTVSQEIAILRQKDEKPGEYEDYYAYCEACKAHVKAQRAKYEEV